MISFPPAFHNQAFILRKTKKWDAARGISRSSSDFQRILHFDRGKLCVGEVEAGRKENEGEENIKSMHLSFLEQP